jgi:hypothetical protein
LYLDLTMHLSSFINFVLFKQLSCPKLGPPLLDQDLFYQKTNALVLLYLNLQSKRSWQRP